MWFRRVRGDHPERRCAGRPADRGPMRSLVLESGSGQVLNLPAAIANVFVADPKVAEVRPASAKTLFVFGSAPGRTTLAAMDDAGHVVAQYQLTVRPSAYNAAEASAAIGRAMPGSHVRIETLSNGLAVTGQVATPADADRAMDLARAFLTDKQTADNRLTVASSTQISLRVRIAEMSRSVSRELGVNWQALQGIGQATRRSAWPPPTRSAPPQQRQMRWPAPMWAETQTSAASSMLWRRTTLCTCWPNRT